MASRKHSKKTTVSTGPKRSPDELLRDKAVIAQWVLEGRDQQWIADQLSSIRTYSLSRQTIANDIKAVRAEWMSISIEAYDKAKQIELARIEEDEKRYLQAWERSLKPKTRHEEGTTSGDSGGSSFEKIIEESQNGNAAFLAGIDRCRARRNTILGLDSIQKSEDINAAIVTLIRAGYDIKLPSDRGEP